MLNFGTVLSKFKCEKELYGTPDYLTKCEITRLVTILNPITRKEETQPINEIGSSHMARRRQSCLCQISQHTPDALSKV